MASPAKASPKGKGKGGDSPCGPDWKKRAARGTQGTFAGRVPPKGEEKRFMFDAVRKEYFESKAWAKKEQFATKSVNGETLDQVYWKIDNMVMDGQEHDEMEGNMNSVRDPWRRSIRSKFA